MSQNRQQVLMRVIKVVKETLSMDEDDVVESRDALMGDLRANSLDLLDLVFRLGFEFDIRIHQTDLFPEEIMVIDPIFVENGALTPNGIERVRDVAPFLNIESLKSDPRIDRVRDLFTVGAVSRFVCTRMGVK